MAAVADFFDVTPRNIRDRIAVSTDMMRELSRYADPDELYHVYARRMSQLYPTARQVSVSRRGLENPLFRVTRFNLWKDQVNPFRDAHRRPVLSGGVIADLLYGDEPRVIDDLIVTPDDPAWDLLEGQGSLLAIPLFDSGVAQNMIVVTREERGAFRREQVPELVWMTNLFSRAMQTLMLSDRLRDAYDAADFELKAIADLQNSLLPSAVPQVAGFETAVHYRTANHAGGDYYDFFALPEGKLGVLVADASGHGTPAAVLMAITHSLAHSTVEPPTRPGAFLAHLNTHLARRYTQISGNFVTAFYGVFDPVAHTLTYSAAGHLPARISRTSDPIWRPLPSAHRLPLGVQTVGEAYPEQTLPFHPADRLVVFTDGIADVVDQTGEPFGNDRLDEILAQTPNSAAGVVASVLESLDSFSDGSSPTDDRTLVVIRATDGEV